MTPVVAWFGIDLRQRWRSLLVLALLLAFASGTVMTAVGGARRGRTALDRLMGRTMPATAVVLANEAAFDWDAVRVLPDVEALTTFVVASGNGGYVIEDLPPEATEFAGFLPADDEVMRTIERPVLLEGRLFDPERPDEVVVTPRFPGTFGRGVGDTVRLHLYTAEQTETSLAGGDAGTPAGPAVEATIVGVVRSPWFSESTTEDPGTLLPSPGLFARYSETLPDAAASNYIINALVRLDGDTAAIPRLQARLVELTGRTDIEVWSRDDLLKHPRDVTGFEAASLLVFAMAAAVAALFLVGQSIVRHTAATVADLQTLGAVGMTPGQARAGATIGPALSALLGWALGVTAAVVASRWFPIGTASLYEPAPGTDLDLTVLGGAGVLMTLLIVGGALAAATLTLRSRRDTGAARRSAVAAAMARTGLPVPMVVGARLALEPGRGRQALPVRPALLGAIIGVVGTVGALTFSNGVDDATTHPERFGQTYHLFAFLGYNGVDQAPADEVLAAVADDPDVAAVNDATSDVAQAGDVAVDVFAFDPVGRPVDVVVINGRMPTGPREMAMGPRTAEAAGVAIGDTIELTGTSGRQTVTVTGFAFVPAGPHNDYATGAWATRDTYDGLFDGFRFHFALVALVPGADRDAVAARLADEHGFFSEPPRAPIEITELRQVRVLPLFLAAFLALLAVGAVGHALATAVRRRRVDLAVLRALGMTRRESRGVVATQATVLAGVGLVFGVPVGVALGRTLWRYVADYTPLDYLPPFAGLALILIVPLAVATANLIGAWPSQRAASMNVSDVLHAE